MEATTFQYETGTLDLEPHQAYTATVIASSSCVNSVRKCSSAFFSSIGKNVSDRLCSRYSSLFFITKVQKCFTLILH